MHTDPTAWGDKATIVYPGTEPDGFTFSDVLRFVDFKLSSDGSLLIAAVSNGWLDG